MSLANDVKNLVLNAAIHESSAHTKLNREIKSTDKIAIVSGRYAHSWRATVTQDTMEEIEVTLENKAPYADYLELGTRTLTARPVGPRVAKRLEPQITQLLARHLSRTIK